MTKSAGGGGRTKGREGTSAPVQNKNIEQRLVPALGEEIIKGPMPRPKEDLTGATTVEREAAMNEPIRFPPSMTPEQRLGYQGVVNNLQGQPWANRRFQAWIKMNRIVNARKTAYDLLGEGPRYRDIMNGIIDQVYDGENPMAAARSRLSPDRRAFFKEKIGDMTFDNMVGLSQLIADVEGVPPRDAQKVLHEQLMADALIFGGTKDYNRIARFPVA